MGHGPRLGPAGYAVGRRGVLLSAYAGSDGAENVAGLSLQPTDTNREARMIVAAHQPHFLPWLGYLDRMLRCDLFILVDHVQFERRGFQNRTMIRMNDHGRWMTVPVVQRSQKERIDEKRICNDPEGVSALLGPGDVPDHPLRLPHRAAFPALRARCSRRSCTRAGSAWWISATPRSSSCATAFDIRTPARAQLRARARRRALR